MLVYRIINYKELELVLNNKFSEIGFIRRREINSSIRVGNTNKYIIGVRYMHFFEEIDNLKYKGVNKNFYICTYDISKDILYKYCGVGKYLSNNSYVYVKEHAVPSNLINFSNLVSIDKISDKYVSVYRKKKIKKI